ncbi:MAG TPA: hypothetical protein VIF12_05130 [Micavibrio sp.]|jgi:hypothetical protein
MNILSLAENIRARARGNGAMGFLYRHSSHLVTICYMAGNLILLVKQGLDFNLEALAGCLLMAQALAAWNINKNPLFLKLAGGLNVLGGFALAISAWGQAGFISQAIGALPLIGSGLMMLRGSADRAGNASGSFLRKYPVVAAGMLQVMFRPFLLYSGLQCGDPGLVLASLFWAAGDLALAASDRNLRLAIEA